jgi:hypothetical protein
MIDSRSGVENVQNDLDILSYQKSRKHSKTTKWHVKKDSGGGHWGKLVKEHMETTYINFSTLYNSIII